ncbi:MAG TPA: glycoside hydrolase, partial [Acidobacteriota bacterium]|nr:glycoside hydrolase [Acidobacteriota bacterium]
NCGVYVDPQHPDIVYTVNTASYKSTDGGQTFTGFKGAPGGDDPQQMWIDPTNGQRMLFGYDQGLIVSLDGGATWSSWYNQSTEQVYHIAADNSFPYWVYATQQDAGAIRTRSRGNYGAITMFDWNSVNGWEWGSMLPDPLDPNIVYGGRGVTRWDRRTGQVQTVGPRISRAAADWRTVRTQPVLFSPVDPRTLFFAANTLWKTRDGGQSWTQISPDLTRKSWDVPESVGKYKDEPSAKPSQRGVIYSVAPSYVDANVIWAGTDDGLIHVTADGGRHWTDVTPPRLGPWAKVSIIDAGRFDAKTAYAAVNTIRLDDMRPHILRTHDGGRTWTEIVAGLPGDAPTNAVREDPGRRGLLFAATEREVFVSFDDGGHWQSLRMNMAPSSVRDIIVKDDDLIAATHGRGFWILDDITPLRQLDATTAGGAAGAVLFKPQTATRVRFNMNTDTPLPPDEPGGENPPDGAIIDFLLKADASGPVTLEIVDGKGRAIRRYSSDDKSELPTPEGAPVPLYWYRQPLALKRTAGMHRFLWDMRYQPLEVAGGRGRGGLPISATPYNTVPVPNSIWAPPGLYKVRLTVDGRTLEQPLTLRMDPRVKTPAEGLAKLSGMSLALYDGILEAQKALQELRSLRGRVRIAKDDAMKAGRSTEALDAFDKEAAALEGGAGGQGGQTGGPVGPGGPGGAGAAAGAQDTLTGIGGTLNSLMSTLQVSDTTPTSQLSAAVAERLKALQALLSKAKALSTKGRSSVE